MTIRKIISLVLTFLHFDRNLEIKRAIFSEFLLNKKNNNFQELQFMNNNNANVNDKYFGENLGIMNNNIKDYNNDFDNIVKEDQES